MSTPVLCYWKSAEWLGLAQAIRESPADDGLRLIAADWLDEHGHPERARIIRMQIAGQTLDYSCQRYVDKRWLWVADRVTPWVLGMAGNGFPEHPKFGDYSWHDGDRGLWTKTNGVKLTYRHGFLEEVCAPLHDLCRHLDRAVADHPVRRAWADDREPLPDGDGGASWMPGGGESRNRWFLPDGLWDRLASPQALCRGQACKHFASMEAARIALSDVLLGRAHEEREQW